MVNAPATTASRERRERPRDDAAGGVFGEPRINPFGDLHALQHLTARLARSLKAVFEPLLRDQVRSWAEPLSVERLADYRTAHAGSPCVWLPLAMAHGHQAFCVMDGGFVLSLLDLFFGGTGAAPARLPAELSPAAEALVGRIGRSLSQPLRTAWEPLARMDFTAGRAEFGAAAFAGVEGDEAVVSTRIGLATGDRPPVFIDLLYPVAALKPHAPSLTSSVVGKPAEVDPAWRNELTRAAMAVRFTVRSVLAEPTLPLQALLDLKPGDVIPIAICPDVPVMIGRDRLGTGTVGTANGQAAIRLTRLSRIDEGLLP